MVFQPLIQRGAAQIFQNGVNAVIGFHHIQHGFQTIGRSDALDGAVQVRKIHAGGLEQHLTAGLGPQGAFCHALRREGNGQIFLDGHPETAQILCAAVEDALAVDAQHFPYGVAPGQHGAHRQGAAGVAPGKAFAAVRAALCCSGQRLQAVWTQACCFHCGLLIPFCAAAGSWAAAPAWEWCIFPWHAGCSPPAHRLRFRSTQGSAECCGHPGRGLPECRPGSTCRAAGRRQRRSPSRPPCPQTPTRGCK